MGNGKPFRGTDRKTAKADKKKVDVYKVRNVKIVKQKKTQRRQK